MTKGTTFNKKLLKADPNDYLTINEAACILRISRPVLYKLAHGSLPFERHYGLLSIARKDLQDAVGLADEEDWLLTTEDITNATGVASITINRWCSRYGIGTKVGKLWRIPYSRFKPFIKEHMEIDV